MAAASLGAPEALIPLLHEFFSVGLGMGAWPLRVVRILKEAGVDRSSRVLDLGCGNGAVAVAVAKDLGCRVLGVDVYAPFVKAARSEARTAGVSRRCTFRVGDARQFVSRELFDVAIMLNLFPCRRAGTILRRLVRPDGLYMLDDAFRTGRVRADLRPAPTLQECREAITLRGDAIVHEGVTPPRDMRAMTRVRRDYMRLPVAELAQRHPEFIQPLSEYLGHLFESAEVLSSDLRAATWLVRRV